MKIKNNISLLPNTKKKPSYQALEKKWKRKENNF